MIIPGQRGGYLTGNLGAPKLYKLSGNAQEFTMSGLDGDAEGGYFIRGMIHLNGALSSYALRTNGLTTNQKGAYTIVDLAPATNAQVASLQFTGANALTAPAIMHFTCEVEARRAVGGVACYRSFRSWSVVHSDAVGANTYRYHAMGSWRDTTTNLTSLSIYASGGTYLLAGSQLIVHPTSYPFDAAA